MSVSVFLSTNNAPRLHSSKPDLPAQECTLSYLNEGGANFVFRVLPKADSGDVPEPLRGKLLRLRKDLAHVQGAKEQLAAFDEHFKPLFSRENLVQFELIEIDDGVPILLNSTLNRLNRPPHRHHEKLPLEEMHGLLITDMTPRHGETLLQLKPKWLAQSPNAPAQAKRCRTCALRAHRRSKKVRTATDAQESCPLDLVDKITRTRKIAAQGVTDDEELQDFLVNEAQPVLHTLESYQTRLDAYGTLNAHDETSVLDLCKAMTLRDCTLFLRRSESHIEARLADLDLKQPEKLSRWQKTEQELIEGGWYTNTENEAEWQQEAVCALSR